MWSRQRTSRHFLTSHVSLLTSRLAACAILAVGAAGCAAPDCVEQVTRGEQVAADAFLHEHLQAVPMVTVGEAYRAMILLADGEDKHSSFDQRQADLQTRGVIRPAWHLRREEPIDRGAVAYMVQHIIKGERGLNSLALGSLGIGDRRYALRDLTFLGVMQPAPAQKYITGGELVFLLGKADAYMAEHGAYAAESVDLRRELEGAGTGTATRPSN